MKERRNAGATHSFRLTQRASEIVDGITYPRRRGGKSRKVSEAIEWYFTSPLMNKDGKMPASHGVPYPHEVIEKNVALVKSIENLRERIKILESEANTPPWWRRFLFRK